MKRKSSRRHLDVDVEDLDRVIDASENGPLSKADRQKLKSTLHALVERLARKRNTEKTDSVLEPKSSSSAVTPVPEPPTPAGHGRNAASAFTGAEKVCIQHAQLKPGDACPECREGRVYRQREPKTLIRIVGQAPLKATVFEMERLRCNACCQMFTARMQQLHQWMEAQFVEHKTEPNSGLGKAISYLQRHWTKLTLFLRQAGAPLDNNIAERALKKAILHRKNALFYKTMNGARVGDLFMSLIHTCELNKVNPFDYLTELLRHPAELTVRPAEWMPWNYRETLARLARPTAA